MGESRFRLLIGDANADPLAVVQRDRPTRLVEALPENDYKARAVARAFRLAEVLDRPRDHRFAERALVYEGRRNHTVRLRTQLGE